MSVVRCTRQILDKIIGRHFDNRNIGQFALVELKKAYGQVSPRLIVFNHAIEKHGCDKALAADHNGDGRPILVYVESGF